MRRNLWWVTVVVAVALIQMTWLEPLRIQGVRPDLVLLLVVYFAVAEGEERAMFTGVIGGLFEDVAGVMVLGHYVLCNVLVGYAIGRVARRLVLEHPVVRVGLALSAGLMHGALFTFIQFVQDPGIGAIHTIMATVIPGAFYTSFIAPIAFLVLGWLFRRPEEAPGGAL